MTDPLTGYSLTPADYIERGLAAGAHLVTPEIDPGDFQRYYRHDYAQRYARLSADQARRQAMAPDPVQEEQRLLREDYEARLASDSPENAVIRYLGNEFQSIKDSLDAAVARGDVDEAKRISDGIRKFTADNRQEINRWRRQELLDLDRTPGTNPMVRRLYANADALLTESWLSTPRVSQPARGGDQQTPMTARQLLDQETPEAVQFAVKSAARKYDLLDDRQADMVANRGNALYPVFQPFVKTYDTTEAVIANGHVDSNLLKSRDDARSALNTYTRFATRFNANEEGLGDFIRGAYSTFAADVTSDQLSKWYDLYRDRAEGVSADTWFTNVKSAITSAVPSVVETIRDEKGAERRVSVPVKSFDPRSLMPIALSAMEKLRATAGTPDPSQLAPALRSVAGRVAALQNVMDRDLASMGFAGAASDAVAARMSGTAEASALDQMWTNAGRFAGAMGAALADDGSVVPASDGTVADPLLTPMFVQAMTRASVDRDFDPVDHLSRRLASLAGMSADEVRPVVEQAIPVIQRSAENGAGPTVQEVLSQLSGFAAKQGSNPSIPERPRENYPSVNPATGAPIDNSGGFVPPAAGAPNASSMDAGLRKLARDTSSAAPASGTEYYADFLRRAKAGLIAADPALKDAAMTLAKTVGEEIGRQELGKTPHERNVIKNTPAMNKAAGEALLYIMEQPKGEGLGLTGLPDSVREFIRSGKALSLVGVRQKGVQAYEAGPALNDLARSLQRDVDNGTARSDLSFPRRATMFFQLLNEACQDAPANIPGDPRSGLFLSPDFPSAGSFAARYAPIRITGGGGYVLEAFRSPANAEQSLRRLLQQQGIRVTPNPRGDEYSIFDDPNYSPFLAAGIGRPGKFVSSGKDKDSGESRKGLDYSGLVWNLDIMLFGKPKTVVDADPVDPMSDEAMQREEDLIREGNGYVPLNDPAAVQRTAGRLMSRLCFGDTALQATMAPVMASYLRQYPSKDAAARAYASLLPLAREKFVREGIGALQAFARREAAAETIFFTRPVVDPNNPKAVIDVPDFYRAYSWADKEQLAAELSKNNPHGAISVGELLKQSPEAQRLWHTYYMARQRRAGNESVPTEE